MQNNGEANSEIFGLSAIWRKARDETVIHGRKRLTCDVAEDATPDALSENYLNYKSYLNLTATLLILRPPQPYQLGHLNPPRATQSAPA